MFRRLAAFAAPLVLAALTASPALAGPPWLSIELPANPLNSTTRGMYLLVRTYHHGTVTQFQRNDSTHFREMRGCRYQV